jgi:peptidoglycan/LPS O-acetylase OafA/YrhL
MSLEVWMGIAGAAVGIAGGIVGTLASFRRARSHAERRYVLKCALGLGVLIGLFLVGLTLLPRQQHPWLWMAYVVVLPMAIMAVNRGEAKMRADNHEHDQ